MNDIAKAIGVSVNAVSLALNDRKGVSESTRIKIMETAQKLGYLDRKIRYIRTFSQHRLCVLIQDIYDKKHNNMEFYDQILYYIIREAKDRGYDAAVHYFNEHDMIVPDCIIKRHIAGIIILGKMSTHNLEKLLTVNIQMVIVDHNPRISHINCVVSDNISGGYMAARYLIKNGFTKIGYVGDFSYSKSIKERYYGFLEALIQEGIVRFEEAGEYIRKYSLIAEIKHYLICGDVDAIKRILPRKIYLPQAYFCDNDAAAVIMIEALKRKNVKIPEEISIIGFDDGVLAENCKPRLTTINVNRELMGQKAVRRLIQLIDNENSESEHTVLAVELIERDSVKRGGGIRAKHEFYCTAAPSATGGGAPVISNLKNRGGWIQENSLGMKPFNFSLFIKWQCRACARRSVLLYGSRFRLIFAPRFLRADPDFLTRRINLPPSLQSHRTRVPLNPDNLKS
jgi:LacI family transcriptional regulator